MRVAKHWRGAEPFYGTRHPNRTALCFSTGFLGIVLGRNSGRFCLTAVHHDPLCEAEAEADVALNGYE
jgi:hypothetical protein